MVVSSGLLLAQDYRSERRYCRNGCSVTEPLVVNFMMEVTKKSGGRYPPKTIYSIICSLKHYLEEKNGSEALNPVDASDKR